MLLAMFVPTLEAEQEQRLLSKVSPEPRSQLPLPPEWTVDWF